MAMQKNNPSSITDFIRGSELWTHQFKMFLTGLSNVILVALLIIFSIMSFYLYVKIGEKEIYAVKTQAEIFYKDSLGGVNNEVQLSYRLYDTTNKYGKEITKIELNPKLDAKVVTVEQAEKIIAPYAKKFWSAVYKSLLLGLFVSILSIAFLIWYWYNYGRNVMKDEQLRGAKLVSKEELKNLLLQKKDNSHYTIAGVPLRKGSEGNNIVFIGSPQSGKSQSIRAFLEQIRNNGKKAVVYDPSGEFTQEFYRDGIDIILNPFDDRSPNWNIWNEIEEDYQIDNIAESLIPKSPKTDDFFILGGRRLFADIVRVLGEKVHTQQNKKLFEILSNADLETLSSLLVGKSGALYTNSKTDKTGLNLLMTIQNYADPFKYLKDEGYPFSLRKWVKEDDENSSWVFITTREEHKTAIKPIISIWISIIIKATMSLPAIHRERMWLAIDEMPTLQKMEDLELSLTNTRKYGLCHIIGLQDLSQLDETYGKSVASTMISTLQTKLILRVTDESSAERLSKIIGKMEVDEKNMSRSMGVQDGRDGDSFFSQRKERSVVMASEIMSLPNLTGYLKVVGDYPVAKVKINYVPVQNNAISYIPLQKNNESIADSNKNKVIEKEKDNASMDKQISIFDEEIIVEESLFSANRLGNQSSIDDIEKDSNGKYKGRF